MLWHYHRPSLLHTLGTPSCLAEFSLEPASRLHICASCIFVRDFQEVVTSVSLLHIVRDLLVLWETKIGGMMNDTSFNSSLCHILVIFFQNQVDDVINGHELLLITSTYLDSVHDLFREVRYSLGEQLSQSRNCLLRR